MFKTILATITCAAVSLSWADEPQPVPQEVITRQLAIPPRLQWRERAGYCGECSIQQSALFYGNYVSQLICREIIDPDQEEDVLVRVNMDRVLEALLLKFEDFDTDETATPQYKAYLAWTKRHLNQGHPVVLTMFERNESCRDYDHILLATGHISTTAQTYHPDDVLIFNDLFKSEAQRRPFKTLHDTREMAGNGVEHDFCIPSKYNFGCAITGVEDESGALLPIRITVDRDDEPDVVQDEKPVSLKLGVQIRNLRPGTTYALYRYDDYKNLPKRDYHDSKYLTVRTFLAQRQTHEFTDECRSNSASFYRCLPVSSKVPTASDN